MTYILRRYCSAFLNPEWPGKLRKRMKNRKEAHPKVNQVELGWGPFLVWKCREVKETFLLHRKYRIRCCGTMYNPRTVELEMQKLSTTCCCGHSALDQSYIPSEIEFVCTKLLLQQLTRLFEKVDENRQEIIWIRERSQSSYGVLSNWWSECIAMMSDSGAEQVRTAYNTLGTAWKIIIPAAEESVTDRLVRQLG